MKQRDDWAHPRGEPLLDGAEHVRRLEQFLEWARTKRVPADVDPELYLSALYSVNANRYEDGHIGTLRDWFREGGAKEYRVGMLVIYVPRPEPGRCDTKLPFPLDFVRNSLAERFFRHTYRPQFDVPKAYVQPLPAPRRDEPQSF